MRLEVGRIDKAHGISGEVLVTLLTDRVERVATGAVLHSDDGPLNVERSRPHQQRHLVKFAELSDREAAQAARGRILYAEPLDEPDVLWVHDLIDQAVVDVEGRRLGTVLSVEVNPASDLLVLEGEQLVPLTFLVERRGDGTLVVDPPAGLVEPIDEAAE